MINNKSAVITNLSRLLKSIIRRFFQITFLCGINDRCMLVPHQTGTPVISNVLHYVITKKMKWLFDVTCVIV